MKWNCLFKNIYHHVFCISHVLAGSRVRSQVTWHRFHSGWTIPLVYTIHYKCGLLEHYSTYAPSLWVVLLLTQQWTRTTTDVLLYHKLCIFYEVCSVVWTSYLGDVLPTTDLDFYWCQIGSSGVITIFWSSALAALVISTGPNQGWIFFPIGVWSVWFHYWIPS